MQHFSIRSSVATLLLAASLPALADTTNWFLRTGPASVQFNASSTLEVNGAAFPGAQSLVSNNTALAFELGYAATQDLAVRLAFGLPPTTTLTAGGALQSLVPPLTGTLGTVTYGPVVLTATYSFGAPGTVRPYVGAGASYLKVFSTGDADLAGLKVDSAWGAAVQAGVDVPLDTNWSLFLDVRKIFVKTSATGTVPALGGPPVLASVNLDPVVIHAGVGYRF
jgi:outer membrane protein